ncbi:peptidyl-prolyl cis-trans isomerase CYP18-2 [Pelomyxa schiedti]|nr:peptidyl-prolyl cis-trans isomerase CYP18-2 [Pelomyxa schiedti]
MTTSASASATTAAAPDDGGRDRGNVVVFETNMGRFSVELYWDHAPRTCRNMYELSKRGYYDDVVFHRVIKDFMCQTGDPTGTGKGGESIYGTTFEDEITRQLKHTGAGIIAMANSGPNTNGSQFYVSLAPCPWLDGKHTIFGRISTGMMTIKRLGNVQTDIHDRPLSEVKIIRSYPANPESLAANTTTVGDSN